MVQVELWSHACSRPGAVCTPAVQLGKLYHGSAAIEKRDSIDEGLGKSKLASDLQPAEPQYCATRLCSTLACALPVVWQYFQVSYCIAANGPIYLLAPSSSLEDHKHLLSACQAMRHSNGREEQCLFLLQTTTLLLMRGFN